MTSTSLSPAVLLDTCALIWLVNGEPIDDGAEEAIVHAGLNGGAFVSPISAWEIGLLSRPKAGRALIFLPDPGAWFARAMTGPGIRPAAFNARMAIAASTLPEPLHGDPADRMLIATARELGMPIVTRDAAIIAYAARGHIAVVPC